VADASARAAVKNDLPSSAATEPRVRRRRSTANDEDAALVLAYLEGGSVSEEAARRLIEKYTNLLGSIAYNVLHDPHVAMDIVQESFAKAFKNIRHLSDPRKFKGWLCCITRTTCIDYMRRNYHHLRPASLDVIVDENIDLEDVILHSEDGPTPEQIDELREQVHAAIRSLPDIYRDVIIMRHLRRMSYAQIARELHVERATVESRLYRARLLLRERLQSYLME
jgi:RNA polymerase sigma-70 factor (ECF subfamily)